MSASQFFIFGYYGWKNAGDDAMLYALLQELHVLAPEAGFSVLSVVPVTIPPQTEGKTRFVELSPLAVSRAVLRSSALILGGGTHIFDYGVRKRVVKILLRIFLLMLATRLLGKKVYSVNIGIGPVSTTWGRFFSRQICRLAEHVSVRDVASYNLLQAWGLADKASLGFDLSALIEPLDETGTGHLPKGESNKQILGISITPVFEIYYNSPGKDILLVEEIARSINKGLEVNPQWEVCLFVFKDRTRDHDVDITEILRERLQPPERVRLIPYNSDPRRMLGEVSQCHAFVGMRYHSCLFAYLNNIPLLVINYHPKCGALAEDIGLPEYATVSLPEILNGQFEQRLKNLMESPRDFQAALPVGLARNRARAGIRV